jgi:zinc transport system substrate-binding protein
MRIVDLAENIKKMQMENEHTQNAEHDDHGHHDEHDHKGDDPHIWTSPSNVKIIAKNIYKALKNEDPANADYYKRNLDIFLASIDETDRQIIDILSSLDEGEKFMVFHPSWGYFAKAYNLEQIAVEVEGKEPKPKELINLLKEAKEEKVKAIFTQPEFSDTTAKIIAKELQIPVVKVSPLAADWSENLINMAKTIAGKN